MPIFDPLPKAMANLRKAQAEYPKTDLALNFVPGVGTALGGAEAAATVADPEAPGWEKGLAVLSTIPGGKAVEKIAPKVAKHSEFLWAAYKKKQAEWDKLFNSHPGEVGSDAWAARKQKLRDMINELSDLGDKARAQERVELGLPERTPTKPLKPVIDPEDGKGAFAYNKDVDYFGYKTLMSPSEFLSTALHLPESQKNQESLKFLRKHMAEGGSIGPPTLFVKWDDEAKAWRTVGHEGRHRSTVIKELWGDEPMMVHIIPQDGKRARDITPEMQIADILPELK